MQRPKHSSYGVQSIPTMQLMANLAKFTGQRKDSTTSIQKTSENNSVNKPVLPNSKERQDHLPNPNYSKSQSAVTDSEADQAHILDPNYAPRKLSQVNVKAYPKNYQAASTVGKLFTPPDDSQMPEVTLPSIRIISANKSNDNNSLIGGQDHDERWQTTMQSANEGELTEKAAHSAKKNCHPIDPDDMISPITGTRIADYGSWAEDLKRRRAAAANGQDIEDDDKDDDTPDDPLIARLKAQLASRGAHGIVGLGRLFKIMDDDGSNSLSFKEFKKAMKECNMILNDIDLVILFKKFSGGNSNTNTATISYDAFLRTISGALNKRRKRLVNMAFDVMDTDGSGTITLDDVAAVYDVSRHPDFQSGKRSKEEILKEFLDGFDVSSDSKDGIVTREEFENYYSMISASIARDDYFELMMRNAWHISGGEGAAANSANRRVLVTRDDGSQYVQEIQQDLGLRSDDKAGLMKRLQQQQQGRGGGTGIAQISGYDEAGDMNNNSNINSNNKPGNKFGFTANANSTQQGAPPQPTSSNKSNGRKGKANNKSNNVVPGGKKTAAAAIAVEPTPGVKLIISKIKAEMKARGSSGYSGLQRRFKIMDDDDSKSLSLAEFKKAMKEIKIGDLNDADFRMVFEYFDSDRSGSIDFEEFIQGVREPMTERRLKLVQQAFRVIDKDNSGTVNAAEIASMYDASKHPEVISRRKTATQILTEFLESFEVGGVKDGIVTRAEFINYYANLSASIDNEDYFELMIRNAWHLSGGEGNSNNTSNMRVMVTDSSGTERVVIIEQDLGLQKDDVAGIYDRLQRQGVTDIKAINGKVLKIGTMNKSSGGGGGQVVSGTEGRVSDLNMNNFNLASGMQQQQQRKTATASRGVSSSVAVSVAGRGDQSAPPALQINTMRPSSSTAVGYHPGNKSRNTATVGSSSSGSGGGGNGLASRVINQMQSQREAQQQKDAADIIGNTLLDVLRVQLLSKKGASGIIDLQRKFMDMDTDGSKCLDYAEFKHAMLNFHIESGDSTGLAFSEQQLQSLFTFFDSDKSGTVSYEELLYGLRGQLSPKLLVLVHQVFDLLDRNTGQDVIDPQTLLAHFDATRHPAVLAGLSTAEEVQKEFLDTFDVGGIHPGMITREEFVRYYTNINATMNDDEEYFELVLRGVWHLGASIQQQRAAKEDYKKNILQSSNSNNNGSNNNTTVNRRNESTVAAKLHQAQYNDAFNNNNNMNNSSSRRPSSASAFGRPSGNINTAASSYKLMGNNQNNNSIVNNNSNKPMNVSAGEIDEDAIIAEMKDLQRSAISSYNSGDYQVAEAKFTEVLQVAQLIYSPTHPEYIKAEKSLIMVQRKSGLNNNNENMYQHNDSNNYVNNNNISNRRPSTAGYRR